MTIFGLHLYQFIVTALSATMIVFGVQKYFSRQSNQTLLKLATRVLVWGSMAAVALFPELTDRLATILGIKGNINAAILTGFILTYLIIFKMLAVIERIEQQISVLIRREALKDTRPK